MFYNIQISFKNKPLPGKDRGATHFHTEVPGLYPHIPIIVEMREFDLRDTLVEGIEHEVAVSLKPGSQQRFRPHFIIVSFTCRRLKRGLPVVTWYKQSGTCAGGCCYQ
jgi:hypothetical protein